MLPRMSVALIGQLVAVAVAAHDPLEEVAHDPVERTGLFEHEPVRCAPHHGQLAVGDQVGQLLGIADRREDVLTPRDDQCRNVDIGQLVAESVVHVENGPHLGRERLPVRPAAPTARATRRPARTGGASDGPPASVVPTVITPDMPSCSAIRAQSASSSRRHVW